jgi:hypothetical protein
MMNYRPGLKTVPICPDCKSDLVMRALQFFCLKCKTTVEKFDQRFFRL